MEGGFLDVREGVFHRAGEFVGRDGLPVLCRVHRRLRRLVDARALQRGDRHDGTSDLTGELLHVDLVTVLRHDVHHVDRADDRDAELRELRGQIEVSLEVRAVDDIEDGVRLLADQIVPRDDLFEGVGGQGINARQVGDGHAVVFFELAFLLFHRDARPVPHELVRAGEGVEQGRFAAVRVARKRDADVHDEIPFCLIRYS